MTAKAGIIDTAQGVGLCRAGKYTTGPGQAQPASQFPPWSQNQATALLGPGSSNFWYTEAEVAMSSDSHKEANGTPRWRYVLLAALILLLMWIMLALLWQMSALFPQLGPDGTITPATATPARPTPAPAVLQPTITEMTVQVDDQAHTITFGLEAQVGPGRQVAEAILWYDTETGHRLERTAGPLSDRVAIRYKVDAARDGMTTTLTSGDLGYWWLVRDTAGDSVRAGSSVALAPSWQTLCITPTVESPAIDFTWGLSESQDFRFYYVPGSAAQRDLYQLGPLAEAALAETKDILNVEYDGQMSIYLVPRVFWQGAAAYADKVQLISYLDRNYSGVETWSYFTHEGTHALAQDLPQPKENGGGPDGVLTEGLAVWASGGHYRREPIDAWAAVTAASDEYLPLADLRAGPFYDFQHEVSYLEAASFVKYLVERYGLDTLKDLYSQATGDETRDEDLVQHLFGSGYAELEAGWLDHLDSVRPTPDQARLWQLEVRSFELMRRYETEFDPDARLLPAKPPQEWPSDTLTIFLTRSNKPVNLVLETALIAARERLRSGDFDGAAALLDDVEASLDGEGDMSRPSLEARRAILELVADQDRAILLADSKEYLRTFDRASSTRDLAEDRLRPPFTAYEQEVVRLDIAGDGQSAEGVVLVHAQVADGSLAGDGQLFAVSFDKTADRWRMIRRVPSASKLSLPPVRGD